MVGMLLLASILILSIGVSQGSGDEKIQGLIMKIVTPEKIEGEYHGPNGYIQFSSEVKDGQRSITVATAKGEPIVVFKKPERASMMTVKMGQTQFLVQMNEPGSGLPRYSDYVVPQSFHNVMDSALSQNYVPYGIMQRLDGKTANEARQRAAQELVTRNEADSIVEAATALGSAGVMGTDSPAAQQFYVLAMRLTKIKEKLQRGAVATSDDTVSTQHSFQDMHSFYAHKQEKTCSECTTGSCPYRGDRSNNCHGMCGRKCSCWWWLCGDCCVHQGCLEHDDCCMEYGFWSFACLTPVGFSCSGYSC
jgi:hypothetical protein